MALDMLVDGTQLDSDLTDIADAIRQKTGKTATIEFPQGFIDEIEDIQGGSATLQTKSVNPTESAQTVRPDSGYDGLSSVSVGAISRTYVGSQIPRNDINDVTQEDEYVIVPSGYYSDNVEYQTAFGVQGTPSASKSAVSNHAVTITPTVENEMGYIQGGIIEGQTITVRASELVSGTLNITANDTYDVTNYASAVVNVSGSGGDTNIERGTVTISSNTRTLTINHSLGVKPKVVFLAHKDIDTLPSATVFVSATGTYLGDYSVYMTSSAYKSTGIYEALVTQASDGKLTRAVPTSASYGFTEWNTTTVQCLTTSGSQYWKQGTYDYIVVA